MSMFNWNNGYSESQLPSIYDVWAGEVELAFRKALRLFPDTDITKFSMRPKDERFGSGKFALFFISVKSDG